MERTINRLLIRKAVKHLKAIDPALSEIIKKHGSCTLKPFYEAPFHALASSIISQQFSAGAARSIKAKLSSALGEDQFTPDTILRLTPRFFKKDRLSVPKQGYLRRKAFLKFVTIFQVFIQ
jgi:DNA-3-methyladenine glycosylase II